MDCDAPEPDWGDVLHGSLHCIKCAGVHRGLGVSTSFCRSLTMDNWTEANLVAMLLGGNRQLFSFFKRQQIENSDVEVLYKTKQAAYYRDQLAAQVEQTLAKRRQEKERSQEKHQRSHAHDEEEKRAAPDERRTSLVPKLVAHDFDVEIATESLGASLTRALPPPGVTPLKPRGGNGSWALVTRVRSGGVASRAGVEVGDYVVAMNGRSVADYDEFVSLFPRCPRPLRLTVRRFRSTSREPEKAPEPPDETFLCEFDDASLPMGFSIERDDATCAARVSKVAPGGKAAATGVAIGDIVVGLGNRQTPTYDVVIATLPLLPKPLVVKFARPHQPTKLEPNAVSKPPHLEPDRPVFKSTKSKVALSTVPPVATGSGGYGNSFRRHAEILTVPDPNARRSLGAYEDDREFDVEFSDGPLGMRIEERSGLVPITVVTHCDHDGQAFKHGVRLGCVVIGLNGEKYLSHAHTTSTLKFAKRPVRVRFRHCD